MPAPIPVCPANAIHKCTAHIPGPYTIPNVHSDVYCVYTNRTPATAMRGFGVTGVDFALECQMDKLARAIGMDPVEFRILNAYRDGDMKAHRREAKNCALIECCQVAAEKANWPIREEFKQMSSLTGGGGERAIIPVNASVSYDTPQPAAAQPYVPQVPAAPAPPPQPAPAPQPAAAQPASTPPAPPPPAATKPGRPETNLPFLFCRRHRGDVRPWPSIVGAASPPSTIPSA